MGSLAEDFTLLNSAAATPIAQLSPDLPDQASRVAFGEVTIVWPYNSVTKTLAFLLAEPDVLLRRAKGQVRVQLRGSSAEHVAQHKLAGGDTVAISLASAQWGKDEPPTRVTASRLEWQLEFGEKLKLEAKVGDNRELRTVDIDHPVPATTAPLDAYAHARTTPPPLPEIMSPITHPRDQDARNQNAHLVEAFEPNEFRSPAFLKRARVSYGSLYEGAVDIFGEGEEVHRKRRKRSRFGRDSSTWRYASPSPSPDTGSPNRDTGSPSPQYPQGQQPEPVVTQSAPKTPTLRQPMAASEARRSADVEMTLSQREEASPVAVAGDGDLAEQQPISSKTRTGPHCSPSPAPAASQTTPTVDRTPTANAVPSHSLFGDLASGQDVYATPRFGAATTPHADAVSSIADKVRFGFSHQPQTTPPPASSTGPSSSDMRVRGEPEQYPASYLDEPGVSKYADMESYVDVAEKEQEAESRQKYGMPEVPPAVQSFKRGQWDMAAQSPDYNPVEGGHFGADALAEGSQVVRGVEALRSDEIRPEQVPVGFDSYGGHESEVSEESRPSEEPGQSQVPGVAFIENEEVEDDSDDGEVGIGEEDNTVYDAGGDIVEEGDYDQRQYDEPSDDDDGLSEEEEEVEQEATGRYGAPDSLGYEENYSDEDAYERGSEMDYDGEYGEEDDVEYDSEEDEGTDRCPQSPTPQATAPKAPIVIDLLSDSDSEDEDAPQPPGPMNEPPGVDHTKSPDSAPSQGSVKPSIHSGSPDSAPSNGDTGFAAAREPAIYDGGETGQERALAVEGVKNQTGLSPARPASGTDDGQMSQAGPVGASTDAMPMTTHGAPAAPGTTGATAEAREDATLQTSDSHPDTEMVDLVGSRGAPDPNDAGTQEDMVGSVEPTSAIPQKEPDPTTGTAAPAQPSQGIGTPTGSASNETRVASEQGLRDAANESPMDVDQPDAREDTNKESSPLILPSESGSGHVGQDTSEQIPLSRQNLAVGDTSLTPKSAETSMDVPVSGAAQPDDSAVGPDHRSGLAQPPGPYAALNEEQPAPAQQHTPLVEAERAAQRAAQQGRASLSEEKQPEQQGEQEQGQEHEGPLGQSVNNTAASDTDPALQSGNETEALREAEEDEEDNEVLSPILLSRVVEKGMYASSASGGTGTTEPPFGPVMAEATISADQDAGVKGQEPATPDHACQDHTPTPGLPENAGQQAGREAEDVITVRPGRTWQKLRQSHTPVKEDGVRDTTVDTSIQLARAAVASRRSTAKRVPEPTRSSVKTRARSGSVRLSPTPELEDSSILLAKAALTSPTRRVLERRSPTTPTPAGASWAKLLKRLQEEESTPSTTLEDVRSRGTKTTDSIKPLNVIAVATMEPPLPVRDRREYAMSFNVTDPSLSAGQTVQVQLSRAHKDHLPGVRAGDAVVLRCVRIEPPHAPGKKTARLRTTDESSWAVLDDDAVSRHRVKDEHPEITKAESDYAHALMAWYASLGAATRAKLDKANQKIADADPAK